MATPPPPPHAHSTRALVEAARRHPPTARLLWTLPNLHSPGPTALRDDRAASRHAGHRLADEQRVPCHARLLTRSSSCASEFEKPNTRGSLSTSPLARVLSFWSSLLSASPNDAPPSAHRRAGDG